MVKEFTYYGLATKELETLSNDELSKAMIYGSLNGGKRLRSIIPIVIGNKLDNKIWAEVRKAFQESNG